jgi:Mg2+/citrate symporter
VLKEHTTQYIWMAGIILILILRYPELTGNNETVRNTTGILLLSILTLVYILIRVLKKTGRFKE